MAILLGTNSPNTSVKYDKTIVIKTIKIEFNVASYTPWIVIILASSDAKLSAAKALAKNPDSVIEIWIVDKKVLESFIRFNIFTALLFPFLIFLCNSYLFNDKKAISVAAKIPLININITNRKIQSNPTSPWLNFAYQLHNNV